MNSVEVTAAHAVIGAVFLDNDCLAKIGAWLQPQHFPDPFLGMVYAAQLSIWEDRQQVDVITVLGRLGNGLQGDGETLGVLVSLAENVLTSVGVEHHAGMLVEGARRHRIADWASRIPTRIDRTGFGQTQELVDEALVELSELAQAGTGQVVRRGAARVAADAMADIKRRQEARASGKLLGLPTGMTHLDYALCGLEHQEYIILSGTSGSGKTAFMLNLCASAAKAREEHVTVASLEMPMVQLMSRLLAAEAGVDGTRMRQGNCSGWDFDALEEAQLRLHALDPYLSFIDKPGISTAELHAEARKINRGAKKGGPRLGLLAVDYLQLVEPSNPSAPREQQVSRVSKDLLRLTREEDICLVALSQLNDAGEIRESKAVWHDCTTWLNLDMDKVPDDAIAQPGRVKIPKQRHGGTSFGGLPVVFIRNNQRFGAQERQSA